MSHQRFAEILWRIRHSVALGKTTTGLGVLTNFRVPKKNQACNAFESVLSLAGSVLHDCGSPIHPKSAQPAPAPIKQDMRFSSAQA